MPPMAFTLQIPADPRFAAIAADAAAKFVELMGGPPADAEAFAAALTDTVRGLAANASDRLTFTFGLQSSGVEAVITVGAGGARSVVRQALAVGQRTQRT
jgi:hypothetical protein